MAVPEFLVQAQATLNGVWQEHAGKIIAGGLAAVLSSLGLGFRWAVNRVVTAFDSLTGEVKSMRTELTEHKGEDVQNFGAVHDAGRQHHMELMQAVQTHANQVTAPLTKVQLDVEVVRLKVEALEGRIPDKRRTPR